MKENMGRPGRPPLKKEILVMCPACHKTGTVAVDPRLVRGALEIEGDSLLQVNVFAGDVCGHDFTVTIDAHFKVRQEELPPARPNYDGAQGKGIFGMP